MAAARNVALKWAANAQSVIGYEAYCGRTAKQIKTRLLPTPATLKFAAAMVRLDVLRDLIALPGQTCLLSLKAFDSTAKSPFSMGVCTAI